MIESMHIIGSRQFGGADRFYVRLVEALSDAGHPTLAVTRPGTPIAAALAARIEQVHVAMRNSWDLLSAWHIHRLAYRRRPAIVQTYMGRATRLTRISRRGGPVHVARLGGYYKLDGYYRHAHAWVGNTRALCDHLVREGLPARSVYFVGNFVEDPEQLSPAEIEAHRQALEIPSDARVLLTAGRFIPKKGFADLLTAFRNLPAEIDGRPLYLVVVGDGPLGSALRKQCTAEQLGERVRWPGWQNRLSPFYALAEAFVCPSRHEPLGNVILEAWSHRVPIVSTRTQGALEIIEDNVNGLLAPCDEPLALARRIRELLLAPASSKEALVAAAARVLAERHSRQAVLDAYVSMYHELVRNNAGGAS
jgi:glycosyltransferase involved in cell wall biosynthesis